MDAERLAKAHQTAIKSAQSLGGARRVDFQFGFAGRYAVYTVPSRSRDARYTVTVNISPQTGEDYDWRCNCQGGPFGPCWHRAAVWLSRRTEKPENRPMATRIREVEPNATAAHIRELWRRNPIVQEA